MKTKMLHSSRRVIAWLFLAGPCVVTAEAQTTAFTYNGQLKLNGTAVSGTYEIQFTLYDALTGGAIVGGPVTLNSAVTNGLFTTRIDFGTNAFTGPARWMDIAVRPAAGGALTPLPPRQEVTSTPYAIQALSAATVKSGGVTSASLADGAVSAAKLAPAAVGFAQLNAPAPPAAGQFLSYSGGNLFWTDPAVASGSFWTAGGGGIFYNGAKVGIGTSTPAHRLSILGALPDWTSYNWGGAIELKNGSALGWQANAAGSRFGIGQTTGGLSLFRTASNPGTTGSPALYDFTINDSGNVVMTGGGPGFVTVGSPNGESGISIQRGGNRGDFRFDGTTLKMVAGPGLGPPPSNNGIMINAATGNVGIGGSATPVSKVEIVAQDALALVGFQPFITFADSNAGYVKSRIQGVDGKLSFHTSDGNRAVMDSTGMYLNGILRTTGNVSASSVTIRGGADLAEPFAMSHGGVEAGMVVVIDATNPGKLKASTRAYDKKVAGIVSGANGIQPGISMIQEDKLEAGENVALSGRVYVKADTGGGAIEPGDQLTTSSIAGNAMKAADHDKAQGAIIGKAMTALDEGTGYVLVLVTLQ